MKTVHLLGYIPGHRLHQSLEQVGSLEAYSWVTITLGDQQRKRNQCFNFLTNILGWSINNQNWYVMVESASSRWSLPVVIVPFTFSMSEKNDNIFFQHLCLSRYCSSLKIQISITTKVPFIYRTLCVFWRRSIFRGQTYGPLENICILS